MLLTAMALGAALGVSTPRTTGVPHDHAFASVDAHIAANLRRGAKSFVLFPEEDEECVCSRTPDNDVLMSTDPEIKVTFDLYGGHPGICDTEECDPQACEWKFRIKVNNNTDATHPDDPGATVTAQIRSGCVNGPTCTFDNATIEATSAIPVNQEQNAADETKMLACLKQPANETSLQLYVRVTHDQYTYQTGNPPAPVSVPALEQTFTLKLICTPCGPSGG